jgi:invasion protein IalB
MASTQETAAVTGHGGGGGGAAGPFQQAVELTFGNGVNEVTGTVAVPAGVHLVIETVTADIGVADGEQAFLFVTTVARGVQATHTITLEELPRMPNVFGATHEVRLYADAGTHVSVMVTRFGISPYPAIPKPELVTLSGRTQH